MDFSWLTDWIVGVFDWFLQEIINGLIWIINQTILAICALAGMIIDLLPSASYTVPGGIDSSWLGVMNWFLPINHIVASLAVYISAMLVLFGVGPILRWVKMVR